MPQGWPAIPRQLDRDVRLEAGFRCAIPTCCQYPIELDHIEDYARVQEHRFENLIALCPNCHALKERGVIDRPALRQIKANLSVLNWRYGDLERRVLQHFADSPEAETIVLPVGFDLLLWFLIRDGYLEQLPFVPVMAFGPSDGQPPFEQGPQQYRLTAPGREFVTRWLDAAPLDGVAPDELGDQPGSGPAE